MERNLYQVYKTSLLIISATDLFVIVSAVFMSIEAVWAQVFYAVLCVLYTVFLAFVEVALAHDVDEARRLKNSVFYQITVSMKAKRKKLRTKALSSRIIKLGQDQLLFVVLL